MHLQQGVHEVDVSACRRVHEGCHAVAVHDVGRGTRAQERVDARGVLERTKGAREGERRVALAISAIEVGRGALRKQPHHLGVTRVRGLDERRLAGELVADVCRRATLEQQRRHAGVALIRVQARVRERVWVRVWVRIGLGSGSGSGPGSQSGVPMTVEARTLRVRPSRGQGLTLYAAQLSAVLPSFATRSGCAFTSSKERTMASWPAQLASTSGVSPWCVRQSTARLCAEPESRE